MEKIRLLPSSSLFNKSYECLQEGGSSCLLADGKNRCVSDLKQPQGHTVTFQLLLPALWKAENTSLIY